MSAVLGRKLFVVTFPAEDREYDHTIIDLKWPRLTPADKSAKYFNFYAE